MNAEQRAEVLRTMDQMLGQVDDPLAEERAAAEMQLAHDQAERAQLERWARGRPSSRMSEATAEMAMIDHIANGSWMVTVSDRWSPESDAILTKAQQVAAEAVRVALREDYERAEKRLAEATAERDRRVKEFR